MRDIVRSCATWGVKEAWQILLIWKTSQSKQVEAVLGFKTNLIPRDENHLIWDSHFVCTPGKWPNLWSFMTFLPSNLQPFTTCFNRYLSCGYRSTLFSKSLSWWLKIFLYLRIVPRHWKENNIKLFTHLIRFVDHIPCQLNI